MKIGHKHRFNPAALRLLPLLAACLLLQGCEQLQSFYFPDKVQQTQYKPLDSEIAALAAPQNPAAPAGPSVYCTVGRGSAKFAGGRWDEFTDTDFVLPPKSRVTINLPQKSAAAGVSPLQGFFDEDGQKMVFCPIVQGAPDQRVSCTSLYALDDDLNAGIKRTFDVPEALRGGAISCASALAKVQKL